VRGAALALALVLAGPALAQVPPAEIGQKNVPAPWWMREPVIASLGSVKLELPANRAAFGVSFSAVDKTPAAASAQAAAKAREVDQALRALGAERVQLTTTFGTRPIYDQYRNKEGQLVDNQRADRIENYEVTARLAVEVRDIAVLERAYRLIVAAKPTGIDPLRFSLDPDNATKSRLQTDAVSDAAARARAAATATGSRLGAVKVIDPSGGVCETEVLAGWPSYADAPLATSVNAGGAGFAVSAAAGVGTGGPYSKPTIEQLADQLQLTLQPPMETLTDQACVIYGLLP
jgi:uncharacterized protein